MLALRKVDFRGRLLVADGGCPIHRIHRHIADCRAGVSATAPEQEDRTVERPDPGWTDRSAPMAPELHSRLPKRPPLGPQLMLWRAASRAWCRLFVAIHLSAALPGNYPWRGESLRSQS